MAYKREEMIKTSLEVIEKHQIVFIDEIFIFTSFCSATFYNKGLEKLEDIKKAIEKNRLTIKHNLRNKWHQSDNPTLQIALYKLIGSEEEYMRLANAKQEINVPQFNNFDNINVNISKSKA